MGIPLGVCLRDVSRNISGKKEGRNVDVSSPIGVMSLIKKRKLTEHQHSSQFPVSFLSLQSV